MNIANIVFNLNPVLQKFVRADDLLPSVSYTLLPLVEMVAEVSDKYADFKDSIIREFGITNPETGIIEIPEDKILSYKENIREYLEQDVILPTIEAVSVRDLDNKVTLTMPEVKQLKFLLKW